MKFIVGMSGASGAVIGVRLLENLKAHDVYLILSHNAEKVIIYETNYDLDYVKNLALRWYNNDKIDVDIASGTFKFDAMIIVPCSTSTLSKIACGISDNLITRVAAVALKEGRRLILVPRETPLSIIVLKRMYELSKAGAVIMPPLPAFYQRPNTVDEVVNYVVGKILDQLDIEHTLYSPYKP